MSFLRRNRTAMVLLAAAALFLVLGVMRGEQEIVFRKAVNICMECIGLG
ncbi:CD1871A family CXXC motif-containing protein [Agathobaculum desmolans]